MNQTRVSLGLKTLPLESKELGQVPSDLDQTFSSVREAQAALIQSAAQLGVIESYNQTPKEMIEAFEKSGSGDIDRTLAGWRPRRPPSNRPKRSSTSPGAISPRPSSIFVTATSSQRSMA